MCPRWQRPQRRAERRAHTAPSRSLFAQRTLSLRPLPCLLTKVLSLLTFLPSLLSLCSGTTPALGWRAPNTIATATSSLRRVARSISAGGRRTRRRSQWPRELAKVGGFIRAVFAMPWSVCRWRSHRCCTFRSATGPTQTTQGLGTARTAEWTRPSPTRTGSHLAAR